MLVGGWSWDNQGPLTNLYFVFHFDLAADVGESFKEYTPSVQVANQQTVHVQFQFLRMVGSIVKSTIKLTIDVSGCEF